MFICMCVCSVSHGSASPFIINMDRMPAVIRRNPVRTHTRHRPVPGKEIGGITQLLQTWTHVNMHTQNCKQAPFMKLRWSVESCSHFKHHLFINPWCGMHTHRHGDRNSADSSVTLQRSTSFPLPSSLSSHPPSFPRNRWSVLSPNAAFHAIFIWRNKLVSHSMNFHKLSLGLVW